MNEQYLIARSCYESELQKLRSTINTISQYEYTISSLISQKNHLDEQCSDLIVRKKQLETILSTDFYNVNEKLTKFNLAANLTNSNYQCSLVCNNINGACIEASYKMKYIEEDDYLGAVKNTIENEINRLEEKIKILKIKISNLENEIVDIKNSISLLENSERSIREDINSYRFLMQQYYEYD